MLHPRAKKEDVDCVFLFCSADQTLRVDVDADLLEILAIRNSIVKA